LFQKKTASVYDDLIDYVERINKLAGGTSCALYVIQNDYIAAECYRGKHSTASSSRETAADSQYHVASVRKSYLGFAAAWALDSGAIGSFDDPVLQYITAAPGDKAALESVTIRHLLTHTHGLSFEEGRIVRRSAPGAGWEYNSANIAVLQTLVSEVTGISVAGLLNEKVFKPLGWTETGWRNRLSDELVPVEDYRGINVPIREEMDGSKGNLFVSARELAYWGYLHLKLGKVKGKQVVPEAVIRTSVTLQSPSLLPSGAPGNGCFWFVKNGESSESPLGDKVPEHSFGIVGFHGPFVLVVPELDLVVVRMTSHYGNYEDEHRGHMDYLQEFSNLAVTAARKISG
jgi:CubicO group peptidase (beta-lactamase class C family)